MVLQKDRNMKKIIKLIMLVLTAVSLYGASRVARNVRQFSSITDAIGSTKSGARIFKGAQESSKLRHIPERIDSDTPSPSLPSNRATSGKNNIILGHYEPNSSLMDSIKSSLLKDSLAPNQNIFTAKDLLTASNAHKKDMASTTEQVKNLYDQLKDTSNAMQKLQKENDLLRQKLTRSQTKHQKATKFISDQKQKNKALSTALSDISIQKDALEQRAQNILQQSQQAQTQEISGLKKNYQKQLVDQYRQNENLQDTNVNLKRDTVIQARSNRASELRMKALQNKLRKKDQEIALEKERNLQQKELATKALDTGPTLSNAQWQEYLNQQRGGA